MTEPEYRKRSTLKNKKNINSRIVYNLRRRIREVLKGISKSQKTMELLGCTWIEFFQYIQNKFREGMSWENYPEWHLDHIIPCANFDLSDPEQQKVCFHYRNLQPLWAKENLSKGSKLNWPIS